MSEPRVDTSLPPELVDRYLWWDPTGGVHHSEDRLLAQIMDIGRHEDVALILARFGEERLRRIVLNAEPGWFSPPSWTFWHYRLGLVPTDQAVPPRPTRHFAT
jgi:hypothetical protein